MNEKGILQVGRPQEILETLSMNRRRGLLAFPKEVFERVQGIIEGVKRDGDEAILEYTRRFDKVSLDIKGLRVEASTIEDAYGGVGEEEISALRYAMERVERVERETMERLPFTLSLDEGETIIKTLLRPLGSVGCYIPGGRASYPSSLIMSVVPARVAGVPRIAVCSPPSSHGEVDARILVAADICGVEEIYRVGGAQAIAALAYGTESIKPVEKIVGPGNIYVTAAKMIVSQEVLIDMPAGPSEVLILADASADPEIISLDLISQAEHGELSICGLVTDSEELADRVQEIASKKVKDVARGKIVTEALRKRGFIALCQNLEEAIAFVNQFAPEHLEIITEKPWELAEGIGSAGLILLGPYTPVSASDYCLGTNHILPTGGFAQTSSGLSILDFLKVVRAAYSTRKGLEGMSSKVEVLAGMEGLNNHWEAVRGRLE